MTIEEANSLYYRHHGKRYSHSRYALGVDAAHEIGVGEIVHARRQHTDNRWYGHRENHMMHRGMSEERIVVSFLFLHNFMMLFWGHFNLQRYINIHKVGQL